MAEVVAILLAAGRSQRMGAFKPLLPFGQTTVIRQCIQHLRQAGIDDIVVVLGHQAAEVQRSLTDLNLRFVINPHPESQMGASIAYGINELSPETEAVLIALVDQPAVPPEVIKTIMSEWTAGHSLIVPEFQGRGGHPVLVDLRFRRELLNLDSSGGLRSFLEGHRDLVQRLQVNSPFIARDMDTWDDYLALHLEVFGVPPTDQQAKVPDYPGSRKIPLI